MSFNGKRVVVTGGAKGLGRAIVEKFVEQGATVVVLDSDREALLVLKGDLPGVSTVEVDLRKWEDVKTEMDKMEALDVLINNAGVFPTAEVKDVTEEQLDFTLAVNFKAMVNTSQLFAKNVGKYEVKGACIVNISSALDEKATPGGLAYCCSKSAVKMLTKCLAVELGAMGIRVNAVRPGLMETGLFHSFSDAEFNAHAQRFIGVAPIPRLVQTNETADLVLFLASSAATMITGQAVAVDGGLSIV